MILTSQVFLMPTFPVQPICNYRTSQERSRGVEGWFSDWGWRIKHVEWDHIEERDAEDAGSLVREFFLTAVRISLNPTLFPSILPINS